MIVVTGAAGFVGSNLVRALNQRGRSDLLLVDDLTDGQKFRNLADCDFLDFADKGDLLERIAARELADVEAIFHQGACSNTMEWNGRTMLADNYEYSKALYAFATAREIPLIYASSAAVYGMGPVFREDPALEKPLNLYAWSKVLFDRWVRRHAAGARSQVVGLLMLSGILAPACASLKITLGRQRRMMTEREPGQTSWRLSQQIASKPCVASVIATIRRETCLAAPAPFLELPGRPGRRVGAGHPPHLAPGGDSLPRHTTPEPPGSGSTHRVGSARTGARNLSHHAVFAGCQLPAGRAHPAPG